jgi:RimK family alpha-L-glutamate ligase
MLLILRSKKKSSKKMRNFNRKISSHLKKRKIEFDFASLEDAELFLENKKVEVFVNGKPLENWKTIYSRKSGSYRKMAFILAKISKSKGIFFIDRFYEKSEDSSDTAKVIQTFQFATNNVPIPKTYYSVAYSKKQLKNAAAFLGFPVIIKQCNTSRGTGVFLAKNKKELEGVVAKLMKSEENKDIFLQEFIPNEFEFRVFVTGNMIGAVEKKIRTKKDEFRNNVHLGAREEFVEADSVKKTILEAALKASKIANIQVAGVDVVEKKNGEVAVFEANSCPGITLNEKISPELNSLANYLEECEKK